MKRSHDARSSRLVLGIPPDKPPLWSMSSTYSSPLKDNLVGIVPRDTVSIPILIDGGMGVAANHLDNARDIPTGLGWEYYAARKGGERGPSL